MQMAIAAILILDASMRIAPILAKMQSDAGLRSIMQ